LLPRQPATGRNKKKPASAATRLAGLRGAQRRVPFWLTLNA
jgi:hypothetical protein